MSLIFVDCEAWSGCKALGGLTEFGAVEFKTRKTFHGVVAESLSRGGLPVFVRRTRRA